MLTPQKKGWSGWSPLPRVGDGVDNPSVTSLLNPRSCSGRAFLKGKGKSLVEELALLPPQASLADNGAKVANGDSAEIRRSFRDAGLLDEASLRRKERETLVQKISGLEKELHEYQYNMGVLLIEKKDWATKYEEISHALAEVDETLKRKKSEHLASISEFEKREENLQKILGVEQQCVSELEKALHEMQTEFAEVKFSSDKKLDDARSLEVGLDQKYFKVEQTLQSAVAKLADANGKLSAVQRKLEDIEAREQKLQKESLCFSSEQKLHETDITEQRKHLLDWENKLQDSQKRLVNAQKSVNEREVRANDSDKVLKKKEAEFAETWIMIDSQKKVLKLKEEDTRIRLSSFAAKVKEAHAKYESLEKMEKHLFAREDKLNDRERVEFQTLDDDHNALLSSKKKEFELDLERQRKSFEEEVESKIYEVGKKKREIECIGNHITEREQRLEIRLQKIMDKEKDLDSKTKALKRQEESVKNDDRKLEKDRQHLSSTHVQVLKSKSELEDLMVALKLRTEHIKKEEENLRLTKEDREEHLLLQFNLKQEIEDYRIMKESLFRDTEDLRQQKEKFEEEWEVLEENKLSLEADTMKFIEERQRIEKWQAKEEERLKNEALEARANFEEELEELRQKKEARQKALEHERLDALEALERERADMNREFELHKHELEMDVLERREEMEMKLLDWKNDFQWKKDIELNKIKSLSDVNDSKSQKLLIEHERLEREKEDLSLYSKRLQVDRLEIWKDIDALRMLSKNLKLQREEFIKEKELFLGQIQQKTCRNCGLQVTESVIFDIQDAENGALSNLVLKEGLNKQNTEPSFKDQVFPYTVSGGRMSWLQKCSLLFSPGTKVVDSSASPVDKSNLCIRLDQGAFDGQSTSKLALSFGVSEGQRVVSDFGNGEKADTKRLNENEREKSSDTQPVSSIQRRDQPSKRGRLRSTMKTHTIKAIVEDAKPMLCQSFDEHRFRNEEKDPVNIPEMRYEDIMETSLGQKRRFAQSSGMVANELDAEESNTHYGSISLGERRKRRQIAGPAEQIPGERRYNFRHSTIAATNAAGQTIFDQSKELKTGCQEQSTATEKAKESGGEESSKPAVEPFSGIIVDGMKAANMLQKATVDIITEVSEVEGNAAAAAAAAADDDDVQLMFSDRRGEDGFIVDNAAAGTEPATSSDHEFSEDDKEQYEKRHTSIGKKIWTFFTT